MMSLLADMSNRLQCRGIDILKAYYNISSVINDIKNKHGNIEEELSMVFKQTEQLTREKFDLKIA